MTDLTAADVGSNSAATATPITLLQYTIPEPIRTTTSSGTTSKRWWRWTATEDGGITVDNMLSFSLEGTSDFRNLSVYSGPDSSSLTLVGSSTAIVSLRVTAGTTYWFQTSIWSSGIPRWWALVLRLNDLTPVGDWVQPPDRVLIVDPNEAAIEQGFHADPTDTTEDYPPLVLTTTPSGNSLMMLTTQWGGQTTFTKNFASPDPIDGPLDYQTIAIGFASHVDNNQLNWTISPNPSAPHDSFPTTPTLSFTDGLNFSLGSGGLTAAQRVDHNHGFPNDIFLSYSTYHGSESISLLAMAKYATYRVGYTDAELLSMADPIDGTLIEIEFESELAVPNKLMLRPDTGTQSEDIDWTVRNATWFIGPARAYRGAASMDEYGVIHGPSFGYGGTFGPYDRPADIGGFWVQAGWLSGTHSSLPYDTISEEVEVVAGDSRNVTAGWSELGGAGDSGTWHDLASYLDIDGLWEMELADYEASARTANTYSVTLLCGDLFTYATIPHPIPSPNNTIGNKHEILGYRNLFVWTKVTLTPSRFRLVVAPPLIEPPEGFIDGLGDLDRRLFTNDPPF